MSAPIGGLSSSGTDDDSELIEGNSIVTEGSKGKFLELSAALGLADAIMKV